MPPSGCRGRGFHHVTSSLPIIAGPTAHAQSLSDQDRFFVAGSHQRGDVIAFPYPVAESPIDVYQYGHVWLNDTAKQVQCYDEVAKEQFSLTATMKTQVKSF